MKRFCRKSLVVAPLVAGVLALAVALVLWSVDRALTQAASQLLFTPTGKELIELTPPGSATLAYIPMSALRDGAQYVFSAPASGSTIVMAAEQSVVSLNPAAALSALTITMPPTPYDGKIVTIFSTLAITTLTLNTSNGATFVPAQTGTLAQGGSVSFIYDKGLNQWHRFQ
jgi:hypothetical protein